MNATERYTEKLKELYKEGHQGGVIFSTLEQFDEQERKEIASHLHEIIQFDFDTPSAQGFVRSMLRRLSPDADLSWIPDWRHDWDAQVSSTQ
ncbi:hypothetical protein J5H75_27385 [Pseudomonas asiatica]|uniref:hypothetical protein n=1 Tax=Pseudomonas asiatica TaxID=2219225 RepID=UPI001AAF0775|nr:hypothetical protein [Pseudomonas asiatica]MBO2925396.1 hypothetical protein [Pseudomonas asiatica]